MKISDYNQFFGGKMQSEHEMNPYKHVRFSTLYDCHVRIHFKILERSKYGLETAGKKSYLIIII